MGLCDNRTVIITGAAGGLGRAYALAFGAEGANVVVNDIGTSLGGEGRDTSAADAVVAEIVAAGGNAIANYEDITVEHNSLIRATATVGWRKLTIS